MGKNNRFLVLILLFFIFTNSNSQDSDSTIYKSIQLDSIVITSNPKIAKQKGSEIHVKVKNTIYANMGNAINMLENIPGMIRTANGLEVRGRGKPIYIIDGREIKEEDILNTIPAGEIEDLTIERAPSSAYSSKASALIYIKTRQHMKDHMYLRLNNILSTKRKWAETFSFDIKYQKGSLSTILTYMYSNGGNLNKETYYRDIYHSDYVFHSTKEIDNPSYYKSHRLNWSNEYKFNKKNRIGLYYYYYHNNRDDNENGKNVYNEKGFLTEKDIEIKEKQIITGHNFSLAYFYSKRKENNLSFIQDIAIVDNKNDVVSLEENLWNKYLSDIKTGNQRHYIASSSNLRYSFVPSKNVNGRIGSYYEYVHSSTEYHSDNFADNYLNWSRLHEHNIALWTEIKKSWVNYRMILGLRYEYTHRKTGSRLTNSTETSFIQYTLSGLYPKVSFSYNLTDNLSLSANYTRKIKHPKYNMMNPGLIYKDSLTYEKGNAVINSATYNTFSLDVDWKDLSFSIGYTHIKYPIIEPVIRSSENSNITIYQPTNLHYYKEWNPSISYNKRINKTDLSIYADLTIPKAEYEYLGEVIKSNIVQFGCQLNCVYSFNMHYSIYTNFQYQSKNNHMITTQESVNKWDVGLNVSLFNDKLSVNFQIMDILHGANYNNVYDKYLYVRNGTSGTNDFRGVRLTLKYTIFNKKINNHSSRGNQSTLDRME